MEGSMDSHQQAYPHLRSDLEQLVILFILIRRYYFADYRIKYQKRKRLNMAPDSIS
jgi:hypothetical protein